MTIPDWAHEYFEHGYAQRWGLPALSDRVRDEARDISKLLQLSRSARVVDLGCGHGRHALALAELGCTVVGLDVSTMLLTRARELASAAQARVQWVRGDMRQLPFCDGCANAALITDAFGFFETDQEDAAVIGEARRILSARGALAMKIVNGAVVLADFRDSEREERDGVEVAISNSLTMDPPRLIQRVRVRGARGEGHYERRQRLYRVEDLKSIFESVGLVVSAVFANTEGAAFSSTASGTIWIVARPL